MEYNFMLGAILMIKPSLDATARFRGNQANAGSLGWQILNFDQDFISKIVDEFLLSSTRFWLKSISRSIFVDSKPHLDIWKLR